jgi:ABC-type branched-subunit amino acid transport system ATPase component
LVFLDRAASNRGGRRLAEWASWRSCAADAAAKGGVVSESVLAARGINKRFGSLVVAADVDLTLPPGARYALIGPNGAGKTTLINLMTGMLRPDAGQILLGGEDVTAFAPEDRVRRGLARTYQINSLFPHLTALESVALAVCERRRVAQTWWRRLIAYREEIDEAHQILGALMLNAVCHRPARELAYGQQRLLEIALALASRPKVLLLDEPAAGVPRDESNELFAAIAGLSRDITVLFIEHDMELVFRFAARVIVMVGGSILLEGTPAEIAADPRVRAVYLGKTPRGLLNG